MKVLIMDDSAIVRKRLIAMLSKSIRAEKIGQAEDASRAIGSVQKLNPEVAMLDMRMPGGNGIDMPLETKKNNETTPVTALAGHPHSQYRRKYVEAGAGFFFDTLTRFDGLTAVLGPLHQIRRL